MPQGPQAPVPWFPGPIRDPYRPALDPTPLAKTHPTLATLLDFLGGVVGLKDPLVPTSSNATVAGAGLASVIPILGMASGGLKAVRGGASAIRGLSNVTPAKENLHTVIRSNFLDGQVIGDKTLDIEKLQGLLSAGDNPERVTKLAQQIASPDGYVERLIVDTKGNVIEGQHRLAALKSLGAKKVPVTVVQDTFEGVNVTGLQDAIKATGKIHSDHVNQIAAQAADMIRDSKTAAQAMKDYEIPQQFAPQFKAAFEFLERKPIKAYHGSPHDFDKFSLEKIGTGEGAQAYGPGLYFAQAEPVAEEYARMRLSGPSNVAHKLRDQPREYVEHRLQTVFPGITAEQRAEAIKEASTRGHMYEVGLHASPDDFLDWDKPLSQQSEKVRKALGVFERDLELEKKLVPGSPEEAAYTKRMDESFRQRRMTGDEWYRELSKQPDTVEEVINMLGQKMHLQGQNRSQVQASEALKNAGVKGIRYLDQGSRGKPDRNQFISLTETPTGWWEAKVKTPMGVKTEKYPFKERAQQWIDDQTKGTSNFVVFDDAIIDIMKKYGLPFTTAVALRDYRQQTPPKSGPTKPVGRQ